MQNTQKGCVILLLLSLLYEKLYSIIRCLLVIYNILRNEISNLTGKHISQSNFNSSRTIKNDRKK